MIASEKSHQNLPDHKQFSFKIRFAVNNRHSGKRTDPNAGIVHAHTRMKISLCKRATGAQIKIFSESHV